jgi:hypothetical protein
MIDSCLVPLHPHELTDTVLIQREEVMAVKLQLYFRRPMLSLLVHLLENLSKIKFAYLPVNFVLTLIVSKSTGTHFLRKNCCIRWTPWLRNWAYQIKKKTRPQFEHIKVITWIRSLQYSPVHFGKLPNFTACFMQLRYK